MRAETPNAKARGFLFTGIVKLVTVWVKRLNSYLRARPRLAGFVSHLGYKAGEKSRKSQVVMSDLGK